jgi:hypothetical protein
MAGLVPAIHVFLPRSKDVDARHKAGRTSERDALAEDDEIKPRERAGVLRRSPTRRR